MNQFLTTSWVVALLIATFVPTRGVAEEAFIPGGGNRSEASDGSLSYNPPAWPEAPDTEAMLRRLGLGTVTVLSLCVATLCIGKRWLRGAPAKTTQGGQLRLVETIPLGNRCSVHLLHSGRHRVLVGIDSTGLKSLVALPEPFETTLTDAQSRLASSAVHENELLVAIGDENARPDLEVT